MNNKDMIQFVDGTFDSLYGHKVIDIKEKYIKTELTIKSDHHQPMGTTTNGRQPMGRQHTDQYTTCNTQQTINDTQCNTHNTSYTSHNT